MTTSDVGGPPVWLLDVDGVLNAVTTRPDPTVWTEWRHGWATALSSAWPITWAPEVVERITRLRARGLADVRWLTTWEEAANASLAPLIGLPTLPLAGRAADLVGRGPHGFVSDRAGARERWWKLDIAKRVLDPLPDRPVVWTDDDLVWEPDAREWAERRAAATLLIAPATDAGLTPGHLRVVEEFCARWAAGQAGP